MGYTKKTWATGEVIEAAALNNMEEGINEALVMVDYNGDGVTPENVIDPSVVTELNKKSDKPIIGTTAPTSIPTYVGQIYIDATEKKIYMAVGTSGLADWISLN